MNGNIECAFIGRLGQDPELKTSAAGKSWTRVNDDVAMKTKPACASGPPLSQRCSCHPVCLSNRNH